MLPGRRITFPQSMLKTLQMSNFVKVNLKLKKFSDWKKLTPSMRSCCFLIHHCQIQPDLHQVITLNLRKNGSRKKKLISSLFFPITEPRVKQETRKQRKTEEPSWVICCVCLLYNQANSRSLYLKVNKFTLKIKNRLLVLQDASRWLRLEGRDEQKKQIV